MARTSPPLPPKVRISHGRYYYVSRQGKKVIWVPLTKVDEGDAALLESLRELHKPSAATVSDLIYSYLSDGMDNLKASTRADYRKRIAPLLKVFGHMPPESVTSGHVAQYLLRREKVGHGASGNREIAILSSAYNYGQRHGLTEANPCRGVRRNRETPRDRYIRDSEFLSAFNEASEAFQDLMAVALLTGLRQGDLRSMRREAITAEGLLMEESKTGKRRLIEWSDRLRYFVTRAASRNPESPYVFTNTRGQPWGLWAIQSAMRRLKVDWRFHDIRAKAESDHKTGFGLMPLYNRAKRQKPVR